MNYLSEIYLNLFLGINYDYIIPFVAEPEEEAKTEVKEEKEGKEGKQEEETSSQDQKVFKMNIVDLQNLKRSIEQVNQELSVQQLVLLDTQEPIFEFLGVEDGLTLLISKV